VLSDTLRAARLGAVVDLVSIGLHHVEFDLTNPLVVPPYSLDIELDVNWHHTEPLILYDVTLELSSRGDARDDDDASGEAAVYFSAVLGFFVVYALPDPLPDDIGEAELEAFGRESATFAAWPYIRETVQSLTARSGIPPLSLEVLRRPIVDASLAAPIARPGDRRPRKRGTTQAPPKARAQPVKKARGEPDQ